MLISTITGAYLYVALFSTVTCVIIYCSRNSFLLFLLLFIGYSFTITAVIPLPLDLLFLYYYSCYSYEHTLASHIKNLLTFVSYSVPEYNELPFSIFQKEYI